MPNAECRVPNAEKTNLVQVAPGVFVDPSLVRVPQERKYLLLDDKGYAELGLSQAQRKTMRRLYESEWVTLYCVAPKVWLLDLDSWRAHMRRVAEDPWFWEDERRMDKYRGAY